LERSAQTDVGGKCHGDHDVWQTKGSRSTRAVRYPARWLNVGAHATNKVDGVSAATREHPFEQVEVLLEVSWREKQVSGPDPRRVAHPPGAHGVAEERGHPPAERVEV